MNNKEKYDQAFISCFSLSDASILGDSLQYNSINQWDSVGHMNLMAQLEEAFNITMETDDIIDFSSYNKGKEIIKKYGVEVQ